MDLTCYVHPSWAPRLRPASPKRDWMDATPESFAYRCLPLAIANAHGWEIGSPCGFRARWNGGKGAEAVHIEYDRDAPADHRPVSLFGSGVLTFHVEGLFRTSPGWNLWVGGPPNAAKHGLAPLSGIIETDWSPYTFTMNWRFTKPGEWVRFKPDEAFCFFFPVERGLLDEVRPVVRPLAEAPDLESAFVAWSASRDAFQEHVRRTRPQAPADRWQKLYYRGVGPSGEPGVPDHQPKVRLEGFAAPRPPSGCPRSEPRERTPLRPAPIAAPLPGAAQKLAIAPDALAFTLRAIGFAGEPAAPCAAPVAFARSAVTPATPDPAVERAAWIQRTIEKQRALGRSGSDVPRLRDVSPEAFLELFYAAGRPVVIERLAADWPAVRDWTPDHLARTIGAAEITYQGDRDGAADFELAKDRHVRTMPFDRFVTSAADTGGNDAYVTAYNSAANGGALAPLQGDVGAIPYLRGGAGMMWIGPAGTFTPLHHDLTNNLIVQVVGRKRVHLLPPSETPRLANTRHVFSDVHDIEDEARLARYPAARAARSRSIEIGPGDALFVPVGWWHQVRSLAFSVTLTYTDFVWPNEAYLDFPDG